MLYHDLIDDLKRFLGGEPEGGRVRTVAEEFLWLLEGIAEGHLGAVAPEVRRFLQHNLPQARDLPHPIQRRFLEFADYWTDYVGEYRPDIPARQDEGDGEIPPPPPPPPIIDSPGAADFYDAFYDRVTDPVDPTAIPFLDRAPRTTEDWRAFWEGVQRIRHRDFRSRLSPQVLWRIRRRLVDLLQKRKVLESQERAQAGDLLGHLGDLRPGTGLLRGGAQRSEERPAEAAGSGLPSAARMSAALPDILWVECPGGDFEIGTDANGHIARDSEDPQHTLGLPTFFISRYPITNAQFRPFVESYNGQEPPCLQRRYWSEEGWAWLQGEWDPGGGEDVLSRVRRQWLLNRPENKRQRPLFLDDPVLGVDNRPVTGVTWFEVAAFCRWLTEALGFDGSGRGRVALDQQGVIRLWREERVVHHRLWRTGQAPGIALTDVLSRYEGGLSNLGALLEQGAAQHSFVSLQQRLIGNLALTRRRGDTETRRRERALVLRRLDELALQQLGLPFSKLCGLRDLPSTAMRWIVSLPSEVQWESAARGTTRRTWPWSSKWHAGRANTEEAGIRSTSAVGCFPQGESPLGCLDMVGNVWEWTRSKWGVRRFPPDYRYPYHQDDGREELFGPELRVIRGGSWLNRQEHCRCSYRFWRPPERSDSFLGFRVALYRVPDGLPGFSVGIEEQARRVSGTESAAGDAVPALDLSPEEARRFKAEVEACLERGDLWVALDVLQGQASLRSYLSGFERMLHEIDYRQAHAGETSEEVQPMRDQLAARIRRLLERL